MHDSFESSVDLMNKTLKSLNITSLHQVLIFKVYRIPSTMLLLSRSIETTNASAFEVFRKIMLAFVYAKDSFMLNDKRQRRTIGHRVKIHLWINLLVKTPASEANNKTNNKNAHLSPLSVSSQHVLRWKKNIKKGTQWKLSKFLQIIFVNLTSASNWWEIWKCARMVKYRK